MEQKCCTNANCNTLYNSRNAWHRNLGTIPSEEICTVLYHGLIAGPKQSRTCVNTLITHLGPLAFITLWHLVFSILEINSSGNLAYCKTINCGWNWQTNKLFLASLKEYDTLIDNLVSHSILRWPRRAIPNSPFFKLTFSELARCFQFRSFKTLYFQNFLIEVLYPY